MASNILDAAIRTVTGVFLRQAEMEKVGQAEKGAQILGPISEQKYSGNSKRYQITSNEVVGFFPLTKDIIEQQCDNCVFGILEYLK